MIKVINTMFQTSSLPRSVAAFALASLALSAQAAPTVSNGNFDNGTLDGWSTYATSNGNLGTPTVVLFDTVSGVSSNALRLQVGQNAYTYNTEGGGGLSQGFFAQNAIEYVISADIATLNANANSSRNADGGTFSLILDGSTIATHSFADINSGDIARSSLSFQGLLAAGTHELRIEVTRKFLNNENTPYQFVDNVTVSSVPEPVSSVLMALGLGVLAVRRVRGGGKAA